jgi:hypothetical protein
VSGTIDSIDATARIVVVRGTTVSVPAAAAIHARASSLTFADLKVGETVAIVATRNGSALIASDVVVEAATTFVRSTCTELANGVSITVDGYLQGSGAIAATRVGGFR